MKQISQMDIPASSFSCVRRSDISENTVDNTSMSILDSIWSTWSYGMVEYNMHNISSILSRCSIRSSVSRPPMHAWKRLLFSRTDEDESYTNAVILLDTGTTPGRTHKVDSILRKRTQKSIQRSNNQSLFRVHEVRYFYTTFLQHADYISDVY